jgi:hypothetical protein
MASRLAQETIRPLTAIYGRITLDSTPVLRRKRFYPDPIHPDTELSPKWFVLELLGKSVQERKTAEIDSMAAKWNDLQAEIKDTFHLVCDLCGTDIQQSSKTEWTRLKEHHVGLKPGEVPADSMARDPDVIPMQFLESIADPELDVWFGEMNSDNNAYVDWGPRYLLPYMDA